MTLIAFACDRCGLQVRGIHSATGTGGFYVVDGDSCWAKYAREGEHFVCDACVHAMPEYQAVYGVMPHATIK